MVGWRILGPGRVRVDPGAYRYRRHRYLDSPGSERLGRHFVILPAIGYCRKDYDSSRQAVQQAMDNAMPFLYACRSGAILLAYVFLGCRMFCIPLCIQDGLCFLIVVSR